MANNFENESFDDSVIEIRKMDVQPFMFEPMPGHLNEETSQSPSSEPEDAEDNITERIGTIHW